MKKNNKLIALFLTVIMLSGVITNIQKSEATDYANNEAKYLKLCSSSSLTNSDKTICEGFNAYLKKKNSQLQSELSKNKTDINNTKATIETVTNQLTEITKQIEQKQSEIDYLNRYIANLQSQIAAKETTIKNRMYSMQTYLNDNSLIDYIFNASSLSDIFSRMTTINELTSDDKELISTLNNQKKDLAQQQENLKAQQASLNEQKNNQAALQAKYTALLAQQEATANNTNSQINQTNQQQSAVDAALKKLMEETKRLQAAYVAKVSESYSKNNSSNNSSSNSNNNSSTSTNSNISSKELGIKIANLALTRQGKRYYWGATGPDLFDCSGLVYWAHNQAGVKIGRTTAAGYASAGKSVSYSELQPGDVITFKWSSSIAHIGIYIGDGKFVEAHGDGSTTVGQYADQCVRVSYLSGKFLQCVYNYRRLY